jgi:hypothetical protein
MSREFAHSVINGDDIGIIDDVTTPSNILDKIPGRPSRLNLLFKL